MKKILAAILLFSFLWIGQIQAAGLVPCGGTGEAPCTFCHFFVMINGIVRFIITVAVPLVATLMLVVGGVMFFFGGAKPDMLSQAKGVITSVVIGLVIIFAAWVIVNTVLINLGIVEGSSLLRWYDIGCH